MTLPPHPLTNFEIQEYYQNEPRFNGVFRGDNLPNNNNNNNNNNDNDNNNNNNNNNNSSSNNNNNNNNIKNCAYGINFDEYRDIGTHWVALYVNNKTATYFDSFGVEHIPREIMKFIACKKIITNIYRIQAYDSIMCGYFCIGFINFITFITFFLKTFNSEFQEVKIWFTDQTSKPAELEDEINITLIIK